MIQLLYCNPGARLRGHVSTPVSVLRDLHIVTTLTPRLQRTVTSLISRWVKFLRGPAAKLGISLWNSESLSSSGRVQNAGNSSDNGAADLLLLFVSSLLLMLSA